jgi:hypothetical protein
VKRRDDALPAKLSCARMFVPCNVREAFSRTGGLWLPLYAGGGVRFQPTQLLTLAQRRCRVSALRC